MSVQKASAWSLSNDKCKPWPYIIATICPLQLNINLTVVTDNLKVGGKITHQSNKMDTKITPAD